MPPSDSTNNRCVASIAGLAPVRPSDGATCKREQIGATARGDTRCSPDQRLALGPTGDRDQNALPRFPRLGDLMLVPVVLQRVVDLVGHPQQRKLAQRCEVADAEVVPECGVDLVGAVDVAVRHAPA